MREVALTREIREAGAPEMSYLYMGSYLSVLSSFFYHPSSRILYSLVSKDAVQGRIFTFLSCRPRTCFEQSPRA